MSALWIPAARQTTLLEETLERGESELFPVGFHGLAQQQVTRSMIGDRQRVAVALVAQHKLAFVVGAPQVIRARPGRQRRTLGARSRPRSLGYQPVTIQHRMNGAAGRNLHRMRQAP